MYATIVVPDNYVTVDGRTLPIDCSAIDGNIRVIQWYDTFGTIEFWNQPGNIFKPNGKLDSFSDYHQFADAWQALAQRLDSVPVLQAMPPHMAIEILDQIDNDPTLSADPLDQAVDLYRKIQLDPDLEIGVLGLQECLRLYNIIQNEPKLKAVYPGVAVKTLQKIEADPALRQMPLGDAVDAVLNPPLPELMPEMTRRAR